MRTTLTLDDDVAAELRRVEGRSRQSFKAVVNDVLRRGLALGATPVRASVRFTVTPKATGFLAGLDPLKLNQLSDELETDRFAADHSRSFLTAPGTSGDGTSILPTATRDATSEGGAK